MGLHSQSENEAPKLKKSQATDVGLHPICRVFFHFVRHMSVHIQRECDGRMAQVFRNRFDVITILQANGCKSMTKIMKANVFETDAPHNLLQMLVYGDAAKMMPQFIGKYKVQLVVESLSCSQFPAALL